MDLCARNETSVSAECVGAQSDALQSGAGNGSSETTNITYSNVSTLLIPQRVRQKGERAHICQLGLIQKVQHLVLDLFAFSQ